MVIFKLSLMEIKSGWMIFFCPFYCPFKLLSINKSNAHKFQNIQLIINICRLKLMCVCCFFFWNFVYNKDIKINYDKN